MKPEIIICICLVALCIMYAVYLAWKMGRAQKQAELASRVAKANNDALEASKAFVKMRDDYQRKSQPRKRNGQFAGRKGRA